MSRLSRMGGRILAPVWRLRGRFQTPPEDWPGRAEMEGWIAGLEGRVAEARAQGGQALDLAGAAQARANDAWSHADFALATARNAARWESVAPFMAWLEMMPAGEGALISVILATRDRPHVLPRALDSVRAQRYGNWELVVVDDGTDLGTRAAVEAISDERVRLVEGPRRGLSAARNVGLDVARGELVCYLDDDNVMHPTWLLAVARVFSERPDVEIAYGISVAEHRIPGDLSDEGWWPHFWQLPFSRELLEQENVTDAGALAHRRQLDEARFDEGLRTGEDWELLLRLTKDREALAIPAISHAYAMVGVDRMSVDPNHKRGLEEIRRRHSSR